MVLTAVLFIRMFLINVGHSYMSRCVSYLRAFGLPMPCKWTFPLLGLYTA
jgi:hypothetical protein